MPTTTYSKLRSIMPESETHWRELAARAHRLRGFSGDEAAAKTHELVIHEVRHLQTMGTSRGMRFCPRCEVAGSKYALIWMGGQDMCGTCHWPRSR